MPISGAGTTAGTRPARPHARLVLAFVVVCLSGCGEEPVGTDRRCGAAPELTPGDELVRVLSGTDPTLDGSYVDYYTLRIATPADVGIEMRSESDVDPFLYLWRGDDRDPLAQAFSTDPAAPRAARIDRTLQPGCYVVGASSWGRESGTYRLFVSMVGATP